MERTSKKFLCVLTNTSTLQKSKRLSEPTDREPEPSQRTGYDVKAVAYIWDQLVRRNKMHVVFATPKGGPTAMDPKSVEMTHDDPIVKHFMEDRSLRDSFRDTEKVDQVSHQDYDALLLVGNHGAMVDFPESHALCHLASKIYQKGGYICAISHGITGILKARKQSTTSLASSEGLLSKLSEWTSGLSAASTAPYLLSDKRVTCPSFEEERKLKMEAFLPFNIEDKLKEIGAKVEHGSPFQPKVVQDDRFITAQNAESAAQWIQQIIRELKI